MVKSNTNPTESMNAFNLSEIPNRELSPVLHGLVIAANAAYRASDIATLNALSIAMAAIPSAGCINPSGYARRVSRLAAALSHPAA